MSNLPPDMGPDSLFGQASSEQRFAPRVVTMEDAIAKQMDRIAYLRSAGSPWAEAVYQLRDMIVGLEDAEFWDGLTDDDREAVEVGEASKEPKEAMAARQLRANWAREGWNGYPCRAVPGPGGRPIYKPTSENLSCALRIIMRLLARRGIAWRTRRVSRLGEWDPETPTNDVVPEGESTP